MASTAVPKVPTAALLTDVATTPISETIRRLWRERRTGDLFVRTHKATKMVFFDAGRIVFAASNVKKERLGEALMELGTISGDDFDRASKLVAQRKVRFGDALVAAGVMTQDDVGPAIVVWIQRIVVSLFDVAAGSAFFEDRPCVIPPEFRVELPIDRVLHAGIRTMTRPDVVLAALGPLDRKVVATGPPAFAIEPEGRELLDQAKAPVTLRQLASKSGGLSQDRLRAVYALVSAGALDDPGKTRRPPEAPRPTPAAPARSRAIDDAIRREIGDQLVRSESLDLEAWLGISPSAPQGDVVKALEQRKRGYDALRSALGNDAELGTDLELLMGRVAMSLRLAQRPRSAPPPAPPAPRPDPVPAPAPPAAVATRPAPAAPSGPAAKASMEVEHLLIEGNIRMSVGDFANAVRTYTRLVQLQPDVADHFVRLGSAMARSPRTARQAEAEFQEAVRLAPKNAEIRFQLGMYYKAMNVRSRSIAELRAALELNPRHKQARAELEGAAPQDSALGSIKKMLGG
jgi:tetratricopeptide (TPR) repeat protein